MQYLKTKFDFKENQCPDYSSYFILLDYVHVKIKLKDSNCKRMLALCQVNGLELYTCLIIYYVYNVHMYIDLMS